MQGAHNAQYGSTHRARFSKPSLYAILALWLPFVDFVIVLENSFDSKMKAGSFVSSARTFQSHDWKLLRKLVGLAKTNALNK